MMVVVIDTPSVCFMCGPYRAINCMWIHRPSHFEYYSYLAKHLLGGHFAVAMVMAIMQMVHLYLKVLVQHIRVMVYT